MLKVSILVIESPSFSYQILYEFILSLKSGSFEAFLITHSSERNVFFLRFFFFLTCKRMTCDQSVLRGSGLVSEGHMTVDIEAVIFLSVDSGPDTGVTTPHNISESDQVVLGGEDCVDLVAFSDLIIIELL
jgi:hypothetical protein